MPLFANILNLVLKTKRKIAGKMNKKPQKLDLLVVAFQGRSLRLRDLAFMYENLEGLFR